jgi:hypothetical protein
LREQGREDRMGENQGDDDARRNEQRRHKAEELIAEQMRRRERARADEALLRTIRPRPTDAAGDDGNEDEAG